MDSRPAGPQCCGRCGGPAAAARVARRRRFRAAVFARPGGELSGAGTARDMDPAQDAALGTDAAGQFRAMMGTLLDISPHILVAATEAGERRLVLPAGLPVWHGGTVQATELRPGERVVVRLAPGRRDVADKVWAGIGRVAGTIRESDATQLTVDEGTTRPRQAVAIAPAAANRIRVRFPQLGPGNLIDVIGLRRGAVLEALIPATSQPAYLASRVTRGSEVVKKTAGVLVAEFLLVAALSPEVGEALARLGYTEPCELRTAPPQRAVASLRRSRIWRRHAALLRDTVPADMWRELCWWYLVYPGQDGSGECDVVFAVEVRPRRPAIRAAVVPRDSGPAPEEAAGRPREALPGGLSPAF